MDHPGDRAQHDDAEDKGQAEADPARHQPLLLRHARDENRDEDDVVDAEHDLHRAQREKAGPDLRIGKPLKHVGSVFLRS
jgi:hypothetical protein